MLRLGATCSFPQCPKSSSSVCMGGGQRAKHPPSQRRHRALRTTTATESNLSHTHHRQHYRGRRNIPPRFLSLPTSRERRSTSIDHAHCRAENWIFLLTPGERHPASILSGPTSAVGLARGFFPRYLFGDREFNNAPHPGSKEFTAQDHGRRLQDEDDEPHFTPGDAALPFRLLASATSRLPSAHALTPSGLLQGFALLQRLRMRCQGSRTMAASYRHTSVAQAPPGRCAVAALQPPPSSPTCGNHRHTGFVCFGAFVFKLRSFRMVKARATASGTFRLIAAHWLQVSAPRRGLGTRLTGCDD
jgi:hypothetical protein